MKKLLFLSLFCGLLLTGCGKNDDSSSSKADSTPAVASSGETETAEAPAEIVPSDWEIPEDILQPDREPFEAEVNGETVTIVPETPAYYMVSTSDALKKKYVAYFNEHDDTIKSNLLGSDSETAVFKYGEDGKITSVLRFDCEDGEYSFESEDIYNYRSDGTLESIEVTKDGEVTNTSYYDEHENWLYETNSQLGFATKMQYEYAEDGKSYKELYYTKDDSEPTYTYDYVLNDNGDPITKTMDMDAIGAMVTEYTYDEDGKCLKEETKVVDGKSETPSSVTTHTYDSQGRKLKDETITLPGEMESKTAVEYYYYK